MKWMIASDIHGSADWCKALLALYRKEKADRLILLGDILYHGPRNDLPQGYAPKEVIALLNPLKDELLCVRGNCDTEVDQMVLSFPILADYALLHVDNRLFFLTHGHRYNAENLPPLQKGSILAYGHTHIPKCEEHENYCVWNPGSVAIPKDGSAHSCIILEDKTAYWKDIQTGEAYHKAAYGC